ncbi:MAG: NUDIX hydrolase [Gammaproteobacteria bacterium]|nr:MAG: NUDIX hydrolase [Gammaproteobacteria bacterium]
MKTSSGENEFIDNYNIHNYNPPLTTVDLVIFTIIDNKLKTLVAKRSEYPAKSKWALPGGIIKTELDDNIDAAAIRILKEKTGVTSPYIEQLQTIGNKNRDPRCWSLTVIYFALIPFDSITPVAGRSVTDIKWLEAEDHNQQLAFDHNLILENAVTRLKSKVEYTALPLHLLPKEFTLTEFQQVFETILGHSVDKSAFRRRIREAKIIEEVKGKMRYGSNRPAKLFKAIDTDTLHYFSRNMGISRNM